MGQPLWICGYKINLVMMCPMGQHMFWQYHIIQSEIRREWHGDRLK